MVYISLVLFCLVFSFLVTSSFNLLLFLVTYLVLFILIESLEIILGWKLWSQQERTSECYDWFSHYLKKDYGIVNGKLEYDLSESIYRGDYTLSNEQSLLNKYNLIFESLHLSKGKRLLDCGCGTGTWMLFCKNKGVEVVGLTLSIEQQKIIAEKGMTAYVKDYRILDPSFIQQFDAISVLGSTEHISHYNGIKNANITSYHAYLSLFNVLKQYLKPDGKILLTVLVQGKKELTLLDRAHAYILIRHYGGYYSTVPIIQKAITENGFQIDSMEDYSKDYHWISVKEPEHFGHWWIPWHEGPLDKIAYIFKGLCTDPFLIHRWLYYGMDSWMYHLGGYQKTPLTDDQVKGALSNLKYFVISLPGS